MFLFCKRLTWQPYRRKTTNFKEITSLTLLLHKTMPPYKIRVKQKVGVTTRSQLINSKMKEIFIKEEGIYHNGKF